jgi:putative PEP-CTERM system TPR-repeat lipoprotein
MRSAFHRTSLASLLLAALLALSTPIARGQDRQDTSARASQFYEDGLRRFESKDYAGAAIQLRNSLKLNNRQLAVHVLLGRTLLANGEPVAAEVALQEALKLGANRAEVVVPLARAVAAQGRRQQLIDAPLFDRASLPDATKAELLLEVAAAHADLGRVREALKAIDESRGLAPQSIASWLTEVPIRIKSRQFTEALAAVDQALARDPRSADAHYLKGSVQHVRGQLAEATALYTQALRLDPIHAESLLARAGIAVDQRRDADALRDIQAVLQRRPDEPRAVYMSAVLAERAGNAQAAREALNRVTALLDPVPIEALRYKPQALILGGLAHHALSQFEKAKPYLEAVQRDQPDSPVVKLLGQIHLAENNPDRAILTLEGYLRAFPNDRQALTMLASAHMSQGRHARASQIMRDALKVQDNTGMRTLLGSSLALAGRHQEAIPELEASYARDPSQIQAGSALVGLYLSTGKIKEAVTLAEGLVKKRPDHAGLANLLGIAYRMANAPAKAKEAFQRSAHLDAAFVEPRLNLARIEIDEGRLDAATTRLVEILKVHPSHVEAMLEAGLLAARRGRDADATNLLTRAADLSTAPDQRAADLALIEHHLRGGRVPQAQEAARRLSAKAPDDVPVLIAQARVAMLDRNPDAARQALTRASRNAGFNVELLNRVAVAQLGAGDARSAAYTLGKSLQSEPLNASSHALMVDAEIRLGELAAAEKRARELATKNPRLALATSLVGDVSAARGKWSEAADHYRRAHQLEPTPGSALRLQRALSMHDMPGALRMAEQWLRANPRDIPVLLLHADNQMFNRQLQGARKSYEAVIAMDPRNAAALNNYAHLLLALNDADAALKAANAALAARPDAAHVIGTAGWMAFKAGQRDRALQLLRDARLRDPDNNETRFYLATALAAAGRKSEARDELRAALQSGKQFTSASEARRLMETLN